jgi:hypothetical protein
MNKEYLTLYDEKDEPVFETEWDNVLYVRRIMMKPPEMSGMIAIGVSAGYYNNRTEPAYHIEWDPDKMGVADALKIRAVRYTRKTRDDVVVVDDAPQIEGETQPSAPPLIEATA